ncbi:MAG: fibronectin type III domain-containing protein, partial [Lentisphaerae bacterium]|nr:fibronectin type III domain-containing protein [Lentisphaerota bacterium]
KLFPNPDSRVRITVSELATWATNHHGGGYVNPATARVRFDNLCIASRRGRDPAFFWRLPHDSAPAEGYAVRFDQEPETTPDEAVTGTAARFTQEDVAPGTWYLHVRAKSREGWGPTAHCRIVIE